MTGFPWDGEIFNLAVSHMSGPALPLHDVAVLGVRSPVTVKAHFFGPNYDHCPSKWNCGRDVGN